MGEMMRPETKEVPPRVDESGAAQSSTGSTAPTAGGHQFLPYERIDDVRLMDAIHLQAGEHLLVLRPFGWHLDGKHIPNAPEQFSREYVCEEHGWDVVSDYGPYVAIVRQPTLFEVMLAALKGHDAYMAEHFSGGPDSSALHPDAAKNWRRVRAALAKVSFTPGGTS